LDGWTSPLGQSLCVFLIITASGKEYIHSLINLSKESHTGEILAQKINEVLQNIGTNNFGAIVSDHASNMVLAKKLINEKYSHIIPIRCIAHHINLITTDIMKLEYSKHTINKVFKIILLTVIIYKLN
jgi:Protein of unknown function (DUF 659)